MDELQAWIKTENGRNNRHRQVRRHSRPHTRPDDVGKAQSRHPHIGSAASKSSNVLLDFH